MEFQNRVLTSAGKALVAQASSANKIIFVRALSSTTYMDANALRNVEPSDLTGPSGTIKTTSATNNVARVIAEYTNQPVATIVKTVAIVARLSTQSDEDAVVVMAQSDPTASIWIPSTSNLQTSIQVSFNVTVGNASTVAVNSAANVSLGDFERLLERTVTTHADGDADEGEDQTIAGSKTFGGNVTCESDFTASGYAFFESSVQFDTDISVGGDVYVNGTVGCHHVEEQDPTILSDGVGGLFQLLVTVSNSQPVQDDFVLRRGSLIYPGATIDAPAMPGHFTITDVSQRCSGQVPSTRKFKAITEISDWINFNESKQFEVLAVMVA